MSNNADSIQLSHATRTIEAQTREHTLVGILRSPAEPHSILLEASRD